MVEHVKKGLVLIATVLVIYVNYLATTGTINGITPEVISDRYQTFITPAGYAFSIWGLIYLGMIAFSVFQIISSNSDSLKTTRLFYIVSCAANIGWILAWHNEQIGLSLIAMLVLLSSLVIINLDLAKNSTPAELLFARIPFSVYFGWISIATVLNVAILLISLGVTTSESSSSIIGIILLLAVSAIALVVRHTFSTFAYTLTIAWALTAIAVKQSGKTGIVVACAVGVVAMLISSLTYFLKDHSNGK